MSFKKSSENVRFTFQTAFNPIFGVDEDLNDFIQEFVDAGSPRFVHFSELWKKNKFIHLIYGRCNQQGLYDILGCIFYRLIDIIQASSNRSILDRICALYLLYAFYGKQPIRNHVRIRVCAESWSSLLQLITEVGEEGHLDVYYVYKTLCVSNAFQFCANRQVLYPGAPLFNSPILKSDLTDHELFAPFSNDSNDKSSARIRQDLMTQCLPVVRSLKASSSGLNQAIQCLQLGLSRYTEAKRDLTQLVRGQDANDRLENQLEEEEYLDGINLINYPDSLNKFESILVELDKFRDDTLATRSKPTFNKPSEDISDYNDDISIDLTRVDGSLREEPSINADDRVITIDDNDTTFATADGNGSDVNETSMDRINSESLNDIGQRRRLLRKASTWSKELAKQMEDVRERGFQRSRRRPTEPKLNYDRDSGSGKQRKT